MVSMTFRFITAAIATAATYYIVSHDSTIATRGSVFLFDGLLMTALFSKYLVEFVPSMKKGVDSLILGPWSGAYYEFRGVQIRFYTVDDEIFIPADDLKKVLTPPLQRRELTLLTDQYQKIPGQRIYGMTENGVLRLLATRTGHRRAEPMMIKFKNWLINEAYPNVKRLPRSAINEFD